LVVAGGNMLATQVFSEDDPDLLRALLLADTKNLQKLLKRQQEVFVFLVNGIRKISTVVFSEEESATDKSEAKFFIELELDRKNYQPRNREWLATDQLWVTEGEYSYRKKQCAWTHAISFSRIVFRKALFPSKDYQPTIAMYKALLCDQEDWEIDNINHLKTALTADDHSLAIHIVQALIQKVTANPSEGPDIILIFTAIEKLINNGAASSLKFFEETFLAFVQNKSNVLGLIFLSLYLRINESKIKPILSAMQRVSKIESITAEEAVVLIQLVDNIYQYETLRDHLLEHSIAVTNLDNEATKKFSLFSKLSKDRIPWAMWAPEAGIELCSYRISLPAIDKTRKQQQQAYNTEEVIAIIAGL